MIEKINLQTLSRIDFFPKPQNNIEAQTHKYQLQDDQLQER